MTVYVLTFTFLMAGFGPKTITTEYPSMEACEQAKQVSTMAAGDRMIRAACTQTTK